MAKVPEKERLKRTLAKSGKLSFSKEAAKASEMVDKAGKRILEHRKKLRRKKKSPLRRKGK